MPAAPKATASDGGATTVRVAEAASPVPPWFEVTALVILVLVPAVVPVTCTEDEHEPLAAMVTPERLTLPPPCAALGVPPQVLVCPLGDATTSPIGSASVNAIPAMDSAGFGLLRLKVKVVVLFSGILAAPNAIKSVGAANTVTLAVETLPAPPVTEVTETVLFCVPAAMPVTFSDSVHDALAARVPPDKVTEPPPAAAAADPPHVLVRPLGDATTSPAGNLSVKATPVNGMLLAAGLTMVNDNAIEPFSGTLAAPNAVEMAGGAATARLADAVLPVPPLADATAAVVLVYAAEAVPVT